MTNRYDSAGKPEGQYQPGSNETVLMNKLGIIDQDEMDDIELSLLEQLTETILDEVEEA